MRGRGGIGDRYREIVVPAVVSVPLNTPAELNEQPDGRGAGGVNNTEAIRGDGWRRCRTGRG